jgi:hypothetical protein
MSNDIHEIVQFVIKRLSSGKSLRGAISELRDNGYSEEEIRDVLLAYKDYVAKKEKEASKIVAEQDKAGEDSDDAKSDYSESDAKSDNADGNSTDAIKKALKKALKDERHRNGEEDPDKDLYVDVKGGKIDKAFEDFDSGKNDDEYISYNARSNTEMSLPARRHHSNNMLWVIVFMIPLLLFAVIYVLTHVLDIL